MTQPHPESLSLQTLWRGLRDYALTLPEAWEDHPWEETVVKVRKKVFVFLSGEPAENGGMNLTVKLTETGQDVLTLPFAEPTGYGLGKSGWVSLHFEPGDLPAEDMLREWVRESYRAVAPKKLSAQLEADTPATSAQ